MNVKQLVARTGSSATSVCAALVRALLLTGVVAFAPSACAQRNTLEWREEVELRDSTLIVVSRALQAAESGRPTYIPIAEQRIVFPGKAIEWRGSGELYPLAVEFENDTPYIAASLGTQSLCEKYGYPVPAVVYFRWASGSWSQVSQTEFPAGGKANLLENPWGPHRTNNASGLIKSQDKNRVLPYNTFVNQPLELVIRKPAIRDACRAVQPEQKK